MKVLSENPNSQPKEVEPDGFYDREGQPEPAISVVDENKLKLAIQYEQKCAAWARQLAKNGRMGYFNLMQTRAKQRKNIHAPPFGLPPVLKKACEQYNIATVTPDVMDHLTKARVRNFRSSSNLPPAEWDYSKLAYVRWRAWRNKNNFPPHPDDQSQLSKVRRRMFQRNAGTTYSNVGGKPLSELEGSKHMDITKTQLKQIIREEVDIAIEEGWLGTLGLGAALAAGGGTQPQTGHEDADTSSQPQTTQQVDVAQQAQGELQKNEDGSYTMEYSNPNAARGMSRSMVIRFLKFPAEQAMKKKFNDAGIDGDAFNYSVEGASHADNLIVMKATPK